jgi:hypothetical protein
MTWGTFLATHFRDWQRLDKSFQTLAALEAGGITAGPLWDRAHRKSTAFSALKFWFRIYDFRAWGS